VGCVTQMSRRRKFFCRSMSCLSFSGYSCVMKKAGRPGQTNHRKILLEVRVTANERRAFQEAAEISGISVSAWVRERLRRIAIRELEEVGRPPKLLLRPRPKISLS